MELLPPDIHREIISFFDFRYAVECYPAEKFMIAQFDAETRRGDIDVYSHLHLILWAMRNRLIEDSMVMENLTRKGKVETIRYILDGGFLRTRLVDSRIIDHSGTADTFSYWAHKLAPRKLIYNSETPLDVLERALYYAEVRRCKPFLERGCAREAFDYKALSFLYSRMSSGEQAEYKNFKVSLLDVLYAKRGHAELAWWVGHTRSDLIKNVQAAFCLALTDGNVVCADYLWQRFDCVIGADVISLLNARQDLVVSAWARARLEENGYFSAALDLQ